MVVCATVADSASRHDTETETENSVPSAVSLYPAIHKTIPSNGNAKQKSTRQYPIISRAFNPMIPSSGSDQNG